MKRGKSKMEFTQEQLEAYKRFITARDNIRKNRIRQADVVQTVDIVGLNHPLFEQNDAWLEYKEASEAWWKVEPAFRDKERMRMSRGDYGRQDSWDAPSEKISDLVQLVKNGGE
jgi:hypothetical protein